MLSATEVRRGNVLRHEGGLWVVHDTLHITPGNWRGFVQIKMRNLETGAMIEKRFGSEGKFEQAYLDQRNMEYLYAQGDRLVLMDQGNYEQIEIEKEAVGEDGRWLKENMVLKVNLCDGKPISIELPHVVELEVVETEPAIKGATVTNVYKAAKMETGAVVQVPPFITQGERIRIDTRTGEYVERAGK